MRRTPARAPRAACSVVWLALSMWLLAAPLAAQEAPPADKRVVAAANAFAQAQEAELGGEHARAAELFELADRIAPTPEALRSATRARLHAGELAAAAGHAEELLRRYGGDVPSRELAEQVLTRSRPELTRFRLSCEVPCTVIVDGLASGLAPMTSQILYAAPGSHEFVVGFEGGLERSMRLQGERGEALAVKVQRPSKSAAAKPAPAAQPEAASAPAEAEADKPVGPRRRFGPTPRLRPVYLYGAAAATLAVGAVTVWSGIDLLKSRDDFESKMEPTRGEFERGERKDLRTTVLLSATGVLAAGTAVIALFTDFRRDGRPQPAGVAFGGRRAGLTLRF